MMLSVEHVYISRCSPHIACFILMKSTTDVHRFHVMTWASVVVETSTGPNIVTIIIPTMYKALL